MERVSFKITFYLRRTRVTKAGLAPILSRLTVNGIAAEIPVKCHIYPDKWSQQKERATGNDKLSTEVNSYLDIFRAKILQVRREIEQEGEEVSTYEIKRRLTEGKVTRLLVKEFEVYCEKRKEEIGYGITKATHDKFTRTLRYLKEYTQATYRKDDLPLVAVDKEYCRKFKLFIQTHHDCHNNGAVNLVRTLRNFLLYAIDRKWIKDNPLKGIPLVMEDNGPRSILTRDELERIMRKEMTVERLERVRDVFVFCCLTGFAFVDAYQLKRSDLKEDEHGQWIAKDRQKTGVACIVPLLPQAREILDKYADDPDCLRKGKLLPIPSNQKMNGYLDEIMAICGIEKKITTHCARHTFATVAASYGMPLNVIAKVLGHTKTKMTENYVHVLNQTVSDEMVKLNQRLALESYGISRAE